MNKLMLFSASLLMVASCSEPTKKAEENSLMKIEKYPVSAKQETQLDFFGTQVNDPYTWLENDTSKQTGQWVDEQIAVTRGYLDKIPSREKLKKGSVNYSTLKKLERQ
jgi:prolyl oligopeptidase